MKKLSKKSLAIIALIAIIIIAGMAIILTIGLNFDLKFQASKKVEIYLNQEFEIKDMKQITEETFGKDVIIQKIEVFEDSANIIAKDITEEQKTNLVNKVNEKYGTELKTEEIEILTVSNVRGRDIVKPYIMPFIIVTVIILGYMAIRYRKLGSIKVMLKTVGVLVLVQAILLSLIAITRIPVGRLTIPTVITIFLLTLVVLTTKFERKLVEIKKEN